MKSGDVVKILGYKAFNKDFTNRYGFKFEVGKIYSALGTIKWGQRGNGFHMCTNFEDCFRYYDSDNSIIAEVIGFGKTLKNDDEYYGYYDMYVCEYLKVVRVIPREEIIMMAKELPEDRLDHLICTMNLTEEETNEILAINRGNQKIKKAIDYYHYGKKNAYWSD